jgi:hypothetical protein
VMAFVDTMVVSTKENHGHFHSILIPYSVRCITLYYICLNIYIYLARIN